MPTQLPKRKPPADAQAEHPSRPFLLILAFIIIALSIVVPHQLFTNDAGKVYYGVAVAITWALLAAMVRGVGFVPDNPILQKLFSGWACTAGITAAAILRLLF